MTTDQPRLTRLSTGSYEHRPTGIRIEKISYPTGPVYQLELDPSDEDCPYCEVRTLGDARRLIRTIVRRWAHDG